MVKHALAVYLARGERALEELRTGRKDEARATLRWRGAAFHNFRALDARAQAQGFDVAKDESAQAIYRATVEVDEALAVALEGALEESKTELGKVRSARGALGRYRSKTNEGTGRFTKTA
jgi:hypothetical protein